MTLVLCDQEIVSRDCENGVLGAFWMSICTSTGRKALESGGWVFKSPIDGLKKNRLVMKIKL